MKLSAAILLVTQIVPMLDAAELSANNHLRGDPTQSASCTKVHCPSGSSLYAQDQQGCGGKCIDLSSAQLKTAQKYFHGADVNGDGKILSGGAYAALEKVASAWHISPAEDTLQKITSQNDINFGDFLHMCTSIIKENLEQTTNCKACVTLHGIWTPETNKCTSNQSPPPMYGPIQYTTTNQCQKDAAAQRVNCGQYQSCSACTTNGVDKKLGPLCAWVFDNSLPLLGGRALQQGEINYPGKCKPASIVFKFGNQPEVTKNKECANPPPGVLPILVEER